MDRMHGGVIFYALVRGMLSNGVVGRGGGGIVGRVVISIRV